MLGLGMHLGSKSAWAGMVLGIWSGISCALVGIIPMNNLVPHVIVSFSFFYSGMGAVALLTQAIWLDRRQRIAKWPIWSGILTVGCFFALAAAPVLCGLTTIESLDPRRVPRSQLGVIPLIEWLVFVMIVVWILSVSIALLLRRFFCERDGRLL